MQHKLPTLNYAYNALEPYIDAQTMELHHTKHHQTYVDKLNGVLEKYPSLQGKPVEELLAGLDALSVSDEDKKMLRNHGGGHYNHSLFWQYLDPKNKPDEMLKKEITATFGSVDEFKKQFSDSALKVFGSGWTWLARDNKNSKLIIQNLPNQDAPIMIGLEPIIGLDVWEHAYYLKYQNKRMEYIEAWWKILKHF